MQLRHYIDTHYALPAAEVSPGCDPTRGALQRFSDAVEKNYQQVQRWLRGDTTVENGCVVRHTVVCAAPTGPTSRGKEFRVEREVVCAEGHQTFSVYAESAREALEKFDQGQGDIVEHEVEVVSLGVLDPSKVEEMAK